MHQLPKRVSFLVVPILTLLMMPVAPIQKGGRPPRGRSCSHINFIDASCTNSKRRPFRGRRGTRCRRRAAWKKEGNKGYPSDQIHCGGGARSGTRRGCGKIVASEDFASFLLYMYLCEVFSFFCTAWYYMCTFSILGCCRMGAYRW